jgi:hypothetical protein
MAVQFAPLPVTLKGISQKSPSHLSMLGELVAADNVQILKGGQMGVELSKRYGTSSLSATTDSLSGITAASPKHLVTLGDTLAMDNDQALFVRQPSVDKWLTRSKQGLNWASKSENVSQSNYQKTYPCHAYDAASGNEIIAWYDEQDGVRYSVRARAYGTWVVHEVRLEFILTSVTWAQALKVQAFAPGDGNFYLLYPRTSGATLGIARINCVTPGLPVQAASLALDATTCPFDAQQTPEGKLLIAAKTVSATTVTVQQWDPLTATSSNLNTTAVGVSNTPLNLSWLSQDPWPANTFGTRFYYVASVDSSAGVKAWKLNNDLTINTGFTVDAAQTSATNLVGYPNGPGIVVLADVVTFNYGHGSYIKSNGALYQRSALIASKVFKQAGVWYCLVRFDSVLQPTLFLYDIVNKRPVGKVGLVGAQWSNTYFTFGYQPWVTQIGSLAVVAAQAAHEGLGQTAAVPVGVQIQGAAIVTFDGAPATSKPAELGNVLHYAGSIPWIFDGAVCTESGFNLFPEWGPVSPFTDSGSGFTKTSGAVYSYRATYTWSDAAGNAYESAPSQILAYTATSTHNVSVVVPTYCLTTRIDVSINLYRNDPTQPTVFRQVNSANVPNDVTSDTVTILDDLFDLANGTDWATRALLYTGNSGPGEPLEHLPPPSCTLMATAQSRVFLAGVDQDPTAVWVSNEVVLGEGVSYHDTLRFRVGTAPTAVVGRDRNIVVFTEDSIWTVTGEFPDNAGGSFAMPTPFKLPHAVGAINPNAIVVTSLGIFFQSKKGIHLLGWDWSDKYIGADIEDSLAGQLITSGLEVPSLHQVRLYTSGGTTLVWDTLFSLWTTFSGQAAASACNWLDQPVFVDSTGKGFVETPSVFGDNGVFVKSTIALAIASPAGLRGYHSLGALQLLGEVRGPHQLNATLAYNGAPTVATSYSAINEALPGDDGVLKWELRPKKRQCSSWQLSISDAQLTVGTTEGFSLQAIVASVGIEGGLDRLRAALRMKGS